MSRWEGQRSTTGEAAFVARFSAPSPLIARFLFSYFQRMDRLLAALIRAYADNTNDVEDSAAKSHCLPGCL